MEKRNIAGMNMKERITARAGRYDGYLLENQPKKMEWKFSPMTGQLEQEVTIGYTE